MNENRKSAIEKYFKAIDTDNDGLVGVFVICLKFKGEWNLTIFFKLTRF